ncbi:sugar ABC transporter ATP-binding protein [Vallitalea guaymasensis]|uniref:Ribose/galactose/methyl galactoside import ATP-binding protein n=1 Tax=Vallitalea guaymasensis TaxID=1185412 RepID=A0A8J8MDY8_9FIRM|nr:sugar ABC transporter ATP-binding protein [Vallitalea guaymasensis]QUH30890.1 sugar ABC transporter ATP-binding protein [Vallitalea guaymasensis]
MSEYILEMLDVVKVFPGVKALKGVDFRVRPGTVHALMGENGAGKSTLMKCLMGITQMTSGKIVLKDKEVNIKDTLSAQEQGISMIHQELNVVTARSVSENIWLGREPLKNKIMIDHKKMKQDTLELLEKLHMDINPDELMSNLTVAKMQMVEIAKAVSFNADIVIMDEPTSALTTTEAEQLFKIINNLKSEGVTIIYISHKMDEIFRICDEITVLRDGEFVGSDYSANMDIDKLISLMVGRKLTEMFPKIDCEIGETILKVENLASEDSFHNVSFELHKGEILGFAGLVGAGRTEIVETIFGIRPKTEGHISINGKEVNINNPYDALKNGLCLLTEDRKKMGIIPVLSVRDNTILSSLDNYSKGIKLDHRKIQCDTEEYIDKLNVKTADYDTEIESLSGGNQQKVLVARALLTNPDILMVDEPTRGIDVGAKAEIHTLLTKLAGEGKAIIMISSEMPEVLGMSDRILTMHEGKMTGIISRKDASQEVIMKYATEGFETNEEDNNE